MHQPPTTVFRHRRSLHERTSTCCRWALQSGGSGQLRPQRAILVIPAVPARPSMRTYYYMRREAGAGGKACDLTRSDMRQYVDQSFEWIPHVEPADAPRRSRRTVLDLKSRCHRSLVNLVAVVDLDRDVQYGAPAPPSTAMPICGVVCASVAKVIIHPRSITTLIPRILP